VFVAGREAAPLGVLRLHSVESPGVLLRYDLGEYTGFPSAAVSEDGKLIAAGLSGEVRVFDTSTGALRQALSDTQYMGVASLHFRRGNARLISSGQDQTLRVWDVEKGGLLHKLSNDSTATVLCDVSPDGRIALTCGAHQARHPGEANKDFSLRLWRLPVLD
jgi:WD40 repeat protein